MNILGGGLCALAASRALEDASINFDLYGNLSKGKRKTVFSEWRADPIVAMTYINGMSGKYHGVTPAEFLEIEEVRKLLNVPDDIVFNFLEGQSLYNFVPKKVPRPIFNSVIRDANILNLEDIDFVCQSVVGNMGIMHKLKPNFSAVISDDIVCKIGSINNESFLKYFKQNKIKSKHGVFFQRIDIENGCLTFRPVFHKSVSLNFIDITKNFSNLAAFGPSAFVEKVLLMLYLRYGIAFFTPKYYEVYLQTHIEKSYVYKDAVITEDKDAKKLFLKQTNAAQKVLSKILESVCIDKVVSGIHLSYDRSILDDFQDFIFLDTSLNEYKGLHPTIYTYSKSYDIVKKYVS